MPLARLLCEECAVRSCLVECHARPDNETRQWHVSTSRKHPLSVISPYGVETHIMRLYSCAVAFIKIVRCLVECHAPPGNETRQWHVSTSRKHPLSVISPYDVETHNASPRQAVIHQRMHGTWWRRILCVSTATLLHSLKLSEGCGDAAGCVSAATCRQLVGCGGG